MKIRNYKRGYPEAPNWTHRDAAWLVECSHSKHKALDPIPASIKPGQSHACNPSTKEVEAGDQKLKVSFG